MKDSGAAKYVLKKLMAAGIDDASVSLINASKTQVKFANNIIVNNSRWDASNISFFLSLDKKIVTSSIHDYSKGNIDKVIKYAIKFANSSMSNDSFVKIADGPFRYEEIQGQHDVQIEDLTGKAVEMVGEGIQGSLDAGAKRSGGVLELHSSKELLLTNRNVEAYDQGTSIYFSLRANYNADSSGYSNYVSRKLKGFDPYVMGQNAGRTAKLSKNPQKLKPKKYDVFFEPYPFANLVDHLGGALSVHSVESGMSFLNNKMNKFIASPIFTMYDYGNLPGGLHTFPFDAEGMPSQKTLLIKDGRLKTYLHNTSTAHRYKTKSTANAGIIAPEPTNLYIEPGKSSSEKMLKDFTGLRVSNTWYTRFQNYSSGDFSTVPRDAIFYYKNGKIQHPVKDIRISDNLLRMFKDISAMSNERVQSSGWEVGTPVISGSAKIKKCNITSSS